MDVGKGDCPKKLCFLSPPPPSFTNVVLLHIYFAPVVETNSKHQKLWARKFPPQLQLDYCTWLVICQFNRNHNGKKIMHKKIS